MAHILITGASGFVGSSLCEHLGQLGHKIFGTVRSQPPQHTKHWQPLYCPNINQSTDWSSLLADIDIIIHCAAANSDQHLSKEQFEQINVDGTINLAQQAIAAKVKQFIYLSTAKVYGETSPEKKLLGEDTPYDPMSLYAQSKVQAEKALGQLGFCPGQLLIIRPPLIYGQGMKGNFISLLKLCKKTVPLPFLLANKKRSVLYIKNLLSFIQEVIEAKPKHLTVVNLADSKDLSLCQIAKAIRQHINKPAMLFPLPLFAFYLLLKLSNKTRVYHSLFSAARLDTKLAIKQLDWQPPYTTEEGLAALCLDNEAQDT